MNERSKGIVALVVLAFVFATMGIFARYLGTGLELFEQTYLRIGLAFVFGVVIFFPFLRFDKFITLSKKDAFILILRSISLYTGVVLFTEAILNTKLSNASLIAGLPFLPLFGYVFIREKLALKTLLYIGIGFVGVALITITDFSHLSIGYGEIVAFLSMLAFDFSYTARKWHSDHLNNMESSTLMFAVGAVFLFVSSLIAGESLPTVDAFTPLLLGALVLSALFNVANLYLTNYGFQRIKVGIAGNILTLEIVFALLFSIFLYDEMPATRELVGGLFILVSVYLVNKSEST